MGNEAGPLVADAEQCSGNDEGGLVVGALFVGQSAFAQLTAREEVQVDDEFVLLVVCAVSVGAATDKVSMDGCAPTFTDSMSIVAMMRLFIGVGWGEK